jgi:hypothetical protein
MLASNCLKMSSLPTLALKSPTKISYDICVIYRIHFYFLREAVLCIISFILCWVANIQNNITPATS